MTDDLDIDQRPVSASTPAPIGSALASLRAEREKAAEKLYLDLPVPRYDNLHIRVQPIEQADVKRIGERFKKSRDQEAPVKQAATIVATACIGIFSRGENGEPLGDPSEWPTFDAEVAAAIDRPDLTRAVDIVRAVYLTDGDIIATQVRIGEWSGYSTEQLDSEYSGN